MNGTSLTSFTTLGVRAAAERLVMVTEEGILRELVEARRAAPRGQPPLTILGGGSNVVLRAWTPGTVCLMRTRGFRQQPLGAGAVELTAAAGERWHDLVRFALGQGLAGVENLALIPGSVGAAPIQNIGAYGAELAERFVALRALDRHSGRVHTLRAADCRFGYRDSLFKHPEGAGLVVLDVTLRLRRRGDPVADYPDLRRELARLGRPRPSPVQVAEAVIRVRRRKLPDPRVTGNAGSFFKNPVVAAALGRRLQQRLPGLGLHPAGTGAVKLSAAQLIDACGWKGRRAGAVGVWPRQPLVLCNYGGATGTDVLAMSEDIRQSVQARFGVDLEREPQVIGHD